jgi:hypothetical protein
MWWKKHKWKVLLPVLAAVILAGAFYLGGNAPGAKGWNVAAPVSPESSQTVMGNVTVTPETTPSDDAAAPDTQEISAVPSPSDTAAPATEPMQSAEPSADPTPAGSPEATPSPSPSAQPEASPIPTMEINPETGKDRYLTDPVPSGKPLPVERQDVVIGSTAHTCTLSISCATILDNMDLCDPEKAELVPEDGWILKPTAVTFYEGESVFNVLQRTCKQLKIQMEFENTPIYNSAYIEGIQNLYEFDVGELSGWMYKVNEWFPNYGCSRYQLKDGDAIEWVYTCDLGYDVGGGYATGG